MVVMKVGSFTFLVLVLALPAFSEATCGSTVKCENASLTPARLFSAALERCRQRCRDSISTCQQIAYHAGSGCCAINVDATVCGTGWITEPRTSSFCPVYGRGGPTGLSPCQLCTAGKASHADVGDLAGIWSLVDVADSNARGTLQVTSGGIATFSDNIKGQFVLLHPRHDENYPGAFFLQHEASVDSASTGWDYAWLDDVTEPPRLIIRRFCGLGPSQCGSLTSPEGSQFFKRTFQGALQTQCMLLDNTGHSAGSPELDTCCTAAAQAQNLKTVADVYVPGGGLWQDVELVEAEWNQGIASHVDNASIWYNAGNSELCNSPGAGVISQSSPGGGPVVAFAERGTCSFQVKARNAHEAGAAALLVTNNGGSFPQKLTQDDNAATPVPEWMMKLSPGNQIKLALTTVPTYSASARIGFSNSLAGTFTELCCVAACRSRVETAVAAGHGGGINVTAICSTFTCSGISIPQNSVALPHASSSCVACPEGLVSGVEGRAHCSACGDGETAKSNHQGCEPCADNSAGKGGTCSTCTSGLVPDDLRRQCISASPTPAPTPAPQCPTPDSTPAPTPAPMPSPNPTSYVGSTTASTDSGGFPWGTVFGVILCLFCVVIIGWFLRKFYVSYRDTGQVDFWGAQRDFQSGVTGGANRMFTFATDTVSRARGGAPAQENGGTEANEAGNAEADEGAETGRRKQQRGGTEGGRRGGAEGGTGREQQ